MHWNIKNHKLTVSFNPSRPDSGCIKRFYEGLKGSFLKCAGDGGGGGGGAGNRNQPGFFLNNPL